MKLVTKSLTFAFSIILSLSLSYSFAQHSYHSSSHSSYKSSSHSSYQHSSSGHHRSTYSTSPKTSHYSTSGHHRSTYSTTAKRDSHGHIQRSSTERERFMRETGYPHGRKGYVIDHIVPLSEGGTDDPSNMQWQTKEDAKAKDKWERGQPTKSKKHK